MIQTPISYVSLQTKNRTWSFQREANPAQGFLSAHALPCFSTYLQKVRSNKTNKKQFEILEKGKYVTPDQIVEAFVGMFKAVDIQILHNNTCPLLFFIIC